MSVRELVGRIQREVLAGNVSASRAADLAVQLAALLANINVEIREAEMAFNARLLKELDAHEKANRARIVAETSPEFERKREARDTKEVVTEMIGSLKYVVRCEHEEMRLSR